MKKNNDNENNIKVNNEVVKAGEVVLHDDLIEGKLVEVPDENIGKRCGVVCDESAPGGFIFINEAQGWRLDHIISFDFAHNAYIKSRLSLAKATAMVGAEFGLSPDDCSRHASDLRIAIAGYIMHYDALLEDPDYSESGEDESTPDELNETLTGLIGDGLCFYHEIYDIADAFRTDVERFF